MPKHYKIKRSKGPKGVYKARPHPLFILLMIVVGGGLIYLGIVIYPPIYSAFMNWGNKPAVVDEPQPQPRQDARPEEPELEQPLPVSSLPERTALKAVYIPPELIADQAALELFLDSLSDAGLNSVMVDIKNRKGEVLYISRVAASSGWNAVASNAMDLARLSQTLADRSLKLIVRMSAFRDETVSRVNLDYAVNYRAPGAMWLDDFPEAGGKPWLNPYSDGARRYITELSLEAAGLGAVMVVLDDYQFPPRSLTGDAYFGETDGVTRSQCLKHFADTLTGDLAQKGARLAIYMPASALASEPNLTLYGGDAVDILSETTLLGALPYQFEDGFESGGLSLSRPRENPANTVREIVSYAEKKIPSQPIVLLQGGGEPGGIQYTAAQIKAQIDKLSELNIDEYILYCTNASLYQITS